MARLDAEAIERLESAIRGAFAETNSDLRPVFYAIGGSHLYGTDGPDSDVDVRGYHCADGARYALLDPPSAQIDPFDADESEAGGESGDASAGCGTESARAIDAGGRHAEIDAGSGYATIDCTSYELRKFGELLAAGNFNAAEVACAGRPVLDGPSDRGRLRRVIASELRPALPARYAGMARGLYRDRLRSPAEADATIKHAIYAVRGLLAAEHVRARGAIEPDFERLAAEFLSDAEFDVATRLLAIKRDRGDADLPEDLAGPVRTLVGDRLDRFDDAPGATEPDRRRIRNAIDDWMVGVRRDTGTLPP